MYCCYNGLQGAAAPSFSSHIQQPHSAATFSSHIQQPHSAATFQKHRGQTPSPSDKCNCDLLHEFNNTQDLPFYVPFDGQSNKGQSILLKDTRPGLEGTLC